VVDPLDGTTNFHRGLAHFAVSIALLEHGMPGTAAAAVGDTMEIFSASSGKGALMNGESVHTCPDGLHPLSLVGLQSASGKESLPDYWEWFYTKGYKIRNYGSAVSDVCQLAAGRLDLTILQKARIWDFAGSGLILSEAGGYLSDFDGKPIFPWQGSAMKRYQIIASNGSAHETLPAKLFRKGVK